MKLEYKPNLAVSEIGQLTFVHRRNVFTVDEDFSGSGLAQSSNNLEKCCFAGSYITFNCYEFVFHLITNLCEFLKI